MLRSRKPRLKLTIDEITLEVTEPVNFDDKSSTSQRDRSPENLA